MKMRAKGNEMQTSKVNSGSADARITEAGVGSDAHAAEKSIPVSDMHCHVAFMANPALFAGDVKRAQARVLAVSVEPDEYEQMREMVRGGALCLALGLHPWWVPAEHEALEALLARFDTLFSAADYIGEVGLDYSPRRVATKECQLQAFRHIMHACF